MVPKLYTTALCSAGYSCLLTAKAINLKLDVIMLDPSKGEHFSPDFLKISPEQTVPTLDDNGFVIHESHVINTYLIQKFAKDDVFYPQDLQERTLIDQSLHFDCGILQSRMISILDPIIKHGVKTIPKDKSDNLIQALIDLETTLQGKKYVAGNNVTVADLNIVTTVFICTILVPIASNRFPNLMEWITRMEALSYYEQISQNEFKLFADYVRSKLRGS